MTPKQVLAWEKAHLPSQYTPGGYSGEEVTPGYASPDPYHYAGYDFDPPAGKVDFGQMMVGAVITPKGQTYVRVDVWVTWQPPRPVTEKVPAAVKVITIAAQPGLNVPHHIPAPVTVADPAKVARIISLLDALDIDPGTLRGCPPMTGRGITLTFLARAGGPALAGASEALPSCGYVHFTIGGRKQPTLIDYGAFLQKVLGIAGVSWRGWNVPQ